MTEEIKKMLDEKLKDINIWVDNVEYLKEGNNMILRVVIDRDEIIDIDTCVLATNIINPILDESDFIKESYILDVTTKEKGDEIE